MFLEIYKSSNKKEMESLAYEYLVVDTLDKVLTGVEKSKQITGMDMESQMKGFVPSVFYTFAYLTELYDTIGNYKYKDVVPVLLCTNFDNDYVYGLNFNFLIGGYRAAVLDFIYDNFSQFYKDTLSRAVTNNTYAVNEQLAKILYDEESRKQFFVLIKNKLSIDLNSIYRRYLIKNIVNIRLIEYDVWKYIPFLSFGESIRGADLAKVQSEILANK